MGFRKAHEGFRLLSVMRRRPVLFGLPWWAGVLTIGTLWILIGCSQAQPMNGFDISGSLIPAEEIHAGGPPRDGIPAIDRPVFLKSGEARFLQPMDQVLGMELNGVVKAYPVRILNWHEIVNDRFGGANVVVSYCPLCGTGVAFSARSDDMDLNFGVSGLLYNSDVLLYDRETESLWSQLLSQAVSGPLKGRRLEMLTLSHTTWSDWRKRHPGTLVLSTDTGFRRDYSEDPYAGYETDEGLYFPVSRRDPRYHPKERVLGLEIDGRFVAYPFAELSKTKGVVDDDFQGRRLKIVFNRESESAEAFDDQGRQLATVRSFWFAWYAFHPDTEVFRAP